MGGILLGYEIGSGNEVYVPQVHTVVCGQTQSAGKTTTLEALIHRSDSRAVAFVTKRSESGFSNAASIPPFFTNRADWQFVESIIEATMRQKMKLERAWIIRACQGARSLEDVQGNIRNAIDGIPEFKNGRSTGKWKRRPAQGLSADVYLQLDEYLKIVIPEMHRLQLAMNEMPSRHFELGKGLNVMRLNQFSTEMQSLVISSVMEQVYVMSGPVTVVVPEAWEFVPEGRNTPVKLSAISLIRKGLGGGKLIYLDSQDITSVDKKLLKQVGLWILGVQREINEVEHTIEQVPLPKAQKPKPEDVMTLRLGEFFVCYEGLVKRVYVCPADLAPHLARDYARLGHPDSFRAIKEYRKANAEAETRMRKEKLVGVLGKVQGIVVDEERIVTSHVEDDMDKALAAENAQLKARVAELEKQITTLRAMLVEATPRAVVNTGGTTAPGTAPPPNAYTVKTALGLKPSGERSKEYPPGISGETHFHSKSEAEKPVAADPANDALYAEFRSRIMKDIGVLMAIKASAPELDIEVKRHVIVADQDSLRGRIGLLIHRGFFDQSRTASAVDSELHRQGFNSGRKASVYEEMDELTAMGFFRKEKDSARHIQYRLVEDMKIRVREAQVA